MKRKMLVEWYGRRFTPGARIVGFLLIIAFGILMAFTQPGQATVEQTPLALPGSDRQSIITK
jgi:hypothetical protein